ncbi:MAG TPA: hypothetical protein VD861_08800 [Pyrinomonadaceae bacterium]|nr:hypothetical protein [Pyrinomonadaceae bacterium]
MILSAIAFCKRASCPSSETLLLYRACGLEAERMVWVASHLGQCDFCGAELQLLTEHAPPGPEEECVITAMPANLRWLAETLLGAVPLSLESLAEPAYEKERLTLTDA